MEVFNGGGKCPKKKCGCKKKPDFWHPSRKKKYSSFPGLRSQLNALDVERICELNSENNGRAFNAKVMA